MSSKANRIIAGISLFLLCVFLPISASSQTTQRVINGGNADEGEYPWMAMIVPRSQIGIYEIPFCGGTLISPRHVLTAAHCVVEESELKEVVSEEEYQEHYAIDVIVGRNSLRSKNGQRLSVEKIYLHPNFQADDIIIRNDIAILELETDIGATPVKYARDEDWATLTPGDKGTILGWGSTYPDYDVVPAVLQEAEIPLFTAEECSDTIGLVFDFTQMICGGVYSTDLTSYDGIDSCFGDSGGPWAFKDLSGEWIQQGIVSFGYKCAGEKQPGAYTKVSTYAAWIDSIIVPVLKLDNLFSELLKLSDHALGRFTGSEKMRFTRRERRALRAAARGKSREFLQDIIDTSYSNEEEILASVSTYSIADVVQLNKSFKRATSKRKISKRARRKARVRYIAILNLLNASFV